MLSQAKMPGLLYSATLSDGTAVILEMKGFPLPLTVWTIPVAGDTVTISYSYDGGTTYVTWPSGAVTAAAAESLTSGITHLKAQRTAGSGTTSTWGIC